MKAVDSTRKIKHFEPNLRASQSLHSRFVLGKMRDFPKDSRKKNVDEITVCIIYKKKKIQCTVKNNTSFQELRTILYRQMYVHFLQETQNNEEKAAKMIKSIVGFESVDGDINFDFRFSLKKGVIEKTKFFYPLFRVNNEAAVFKYKIYHCLAIGGFSKVYLARSLQNGQFYAIKFIKKYRLKNEEEVQDLDKFDSMKNEVEVCNDLDHPFLVKMIHAFETHNFYCMVFQYCPGGELFYLLKRVKIMSENMARFYFLQILYGIQYLHSKSILYRDLKPQNILIDADGNCKIVDFGLSKKIDSRSKTFSYCGSAQYMAPEMILRTGHSFGVDYYSLGAFLYELVTGLPPFYTKNHQKLQESIICQQLSFPPHIELSNQIKDLLEKLLKKEEKYRLGSYIGVKEILFHPWIGKVNGAEILGKMIKSPVVPDIKEHNFDSTELGDDEQEFTALVFEDSSQKDCILKEYISSKADNGGLMREIAPIIIKCNEQAKENRLQSKSESILSFIRKQKSKEKIKEVFKSQRSNILERIDRNGSKQKSIRLGVSSEQKKKKEFIRLSPYLNCKQVSPKKQKEMMNFIENRLMKMQRGPHRTLKRMKIQKNKLI